MYPLFENRGIIAPSGSPISLKRTFVSISDDIGLDEKTIRNIFRDYINRLEKTVQFERA
jgi:hypothetical protein